MPIDRGNLRGLVRATAYDAGGSRLGRVAQVFIDDRTDEPAWVAVDVARARGMRLLPLAGAGLKGRHLVIRADRRTVRSAPRIDLGDGQLSSQDESRLLEHYGLAPASGHLPQTGNHRPASPWPDDNERETAWERPTHYGAMSQDTQALSHGWEQPTAGNPPGQQQSTDQATPLTPSWDAPVREQTAPPSTVNQPAADRPPTPQAAHRAVDGPAPTRPAEPPAPPADRPAAQGLSRDTAPTPVPPAPSPPATPHADPQSEGSSSTSPTR